MTEKYRWSTAHEWFRHHVRSIADEGDNCSRLVSIINAIAPQLDGDTIQDMFQEEMENDLYFLDWNAVNLHNADPEGDDWSVEECKHVLSNQLKVSEQTLSTVHYGTNTRKSRQVWQEYTAKAIEEFIDKIEDLD